MCLGSSFSEAWNVALGVQLPRELKGSINLPACSRRNRRETGERRERWGEQSEAGRRKGRALWLLAEAKPHRILALALAGLMVWKNPFKLSESFSPPGSPLGMRPLWGRQLMGDNGMIIS